MKYELKKTIQSAIQRADQKKLTYKGELYPHEAYFLMQNENSYLVDIRTKEELNLVGIIPNAFWIEWTSYISGEINSEFINNMDNKFLLMIQFFLFAEVVLDHMMQQISYKKWL